MDFNIGVFARFEIFEGVDLRISETTIGIWIVMAVLIAMCLYVRAKSKNWDSSKKPEGLQNFAELCVGGFINFFNGTANKKMSFLAPWFFTLFVFLFFSNILGVFGLRPPTADWGLTFPLALVSFCLIQFSGLYARPKSYLKSIFVDPSPYVAPFFAPLNVIGELVRPIALSFRLFGNILGGFILMSLLYGIAPVPLRLFFPVPLHMFFDLAVGLLQAFIFTVLSLAFVGGASSGTE